MAKRGNQEGSIFQRADGRWCAVVSLGWRNGKRWRKCYYGATRDEVGRQLASGLRDHQHGLNIAPERQTVAQFLDRWLKQCVAPTTRTNTLVSYSATVRLHIKPHVGHIPLAKLSPQHVQAMVNDLVGSPAAAKGRRTPKGLSARTAGYARTVLRVALNQALAWNLVHRNAAALANPPRVESKPIQPFSPDEARAFLTAVAGDRLEALYAAALALGLRLGESLGLRWEDIDLDAATLTVSGQLQRVKGQGLQRVPCKTSRSRRTIPLPVTVVMALRAHRARQLEARLLAGPRWQDKGYVFTSRHGTPIDQGLVVSRFKKVLGKAKLRDQRFHDLRHACASLLLDQGVAPRAVMETLGHSQISLTMDTYAHVMPTMLRHVAETMDTVLAARAPAAETPQAAS